METLTIEFYISPIGYGDGIMFDKKVHVRFPVGDSEVLSDIIQTTIDALREKGYEVNEE